MCFNHICSPLLTLLIPTLPAFTFLPIQPGVFLFSPPSQICATQLLLGVSPTMECSHLTRVHLIKRK